MNRQRARRNPYPVRKVLTEQDINRRLERLVARSYGVALAERTGLDGFADVEDIEQLGSFFKKLKKVVKKVVQAPLKIIEKSTHDTLKILPIGSDKLKAKIEGVLLKPVRIQAAINTALTTGDVKDLKTMAKKDVKVAKDVLKVVLPIVAVVAQFFPGIGTVIGIAAGLASAAMKASAARSDAKRLRAQADQASADQAAQLNAQAAQLEAQAAAMDQAAADVQAAMNAGYVKDGMTSEQIRDGVAKYLLDQKGVTISDSESQLLLDDSIKQAIAQATAQQTQFNQAVQTAATQLVQSGQVATDGSGNSLYSTSLYSSGGGSASSPASRVDTSSDDGSDTDTSAKPVAAGIGGGSLIGALVVAGLIYGLAKSGKHHGKT